MRLLLSEILIPINYTSAQRIAIIILCLGLLVYPGVANGISGYFPELDPPLDERDPGPEARHSSGWRAVTPTVEWEYHKSSDNRHPDSSEQQMMWLMNRARSNPAAEGIWLADIYDRYHVHLPDCGRLIDDAGHCYIDGAIAYWGVDLDLMQNEFAGYDTKPPAAFDVRLYRAAKNHSEYLISIEGQNHTDQFSRIDDQHFFYRRARGNVFSYSLDAVYGHAAFNVDWGPDGGSGTGMQSPPGHRLAIMAVDGDYTNVGIAAVPAPDSAAVGPLVVTGNFCEANPSAADHYNRFLVGTVWADKDDDNLYDPGEGIGGVTVMPDQGAYFAVTSNAGGYALPILAPGAYSITFSDAVMASSAVKAGSGSAALGGTFVKSVTVADESVLLDLIVDSASTSPAGGADGGGQGCFIASATMGESAARRLWIFYNGCSAILCAAAAIPGFYRSRVGR